MKMEFDRSKRTEENDWIAAAADCGLLRYANEFVERNGRLRFASPTIAHHHRRHRNREREKKRAMAQVKEWIDKEAFDPPSTDGCKFCDAAVVTHIHEHIHYHCNCNCS